MRLEMIAYSAAFQSKALNPGYRGDPPQPVSAGIGRRVRSQGHSHLADLLRRLADLGLVRVRGVSQRSRIEPLIRAYLRVEGRLDEQPGGVPKAAHFSSSADKQQAAKSDVERCACCGDLEESLRFYVASRRPRRRARLRLHRDQCQLFVGQLD